MTTDASLFCVCFFNACAHGWAHTNLDSIVWWLNLMQNTCSAVTDIYCLREILSASGANELDLQHYREQLLHRVNHSAICHRFTMSSHKDTYTPPCCPKLVCGKSLGKGHNHRICSLSSFSPPSFSLSTDVTQLSLSTDHQGMPLCIPIIV